MTETKYVRTIHNLENQNVEDFVKADVYEVLEAFDVKCPARQHAAKKVLCAGIRGKGDATQDLIEARDALNRAIELEIRRVNNEQRKSDLAGLRIPAHVHSTVLAEPVPGKAETENDKSSFGTGSRAVRGGQRASAATGKRTRK